MKGFGEIEYDTNISQIPIVMPLTPDSHWIILGYKNFKLIEVYVPSSLETIYGQNMSTKLIKAEVDVAGVWYQIQGGRPRVRDTTLINLCNVCSAFDINL